jgi:hypothetical protein
MHKINGFMRNIIKDGTFQQMKNITIHCNSDKVKANLYGGVDIQICVFLTSALAESGHPHAPAVLSPVSIA